MAKRVVRSSVKRLSTVEKKARILKAAEKVFAFGMSNGGGMAQRLACQGTNIRGIGSEVAHYHPFPSPVSYTHLTLPTILRV